MGVWNSDIWRFKRQPDVRTCTCHGVVRTADTLPSSVTMPPDTAGASPVKENQSRDLPPTADKSAAPLTSPVSALNPAYTRYSLVHHTETPCGGIATE